MNCEAIQTLLDHSDLNAISDSERSAVQSHIESCPDCAAALAVHDEFLAMRIPSVPADLEQRCFERIASAPDVRASRRRVGPFVLGSVVIAAAAAAIVGSTWFAAEYEADVAEDSQTSDSASVQSATDPGTGPVPDSFSANEGDVNASSTTGAPTSAEPFAVELTRLVPADETQLSELFADWFHAALVEELSRVPNLVLIEARGVIEVPSIPIIDWSATERPLFDRDTTTWPGDFDIRLAAGASVGDDWVGIRWEAQSVDGHGTGQSSEPDAMRSSVEVGPEYAAVLAAEVVELLRIDLFPADASSLASQFARYEAILMDESADIGQRSLAFDAVRQLARRANDANITARFVDGTLAYAAQIEDAMLNSSDYARIASRIPATEMPAVRAQVEDFPAGILGALSGLGDARVIGPMSEALLYDQSEEVRLAATRILGEFADDAVAHATLESAATSDASAQVREAASNYLLDDAVHLEGIFASVRDSSLSDEERYSTLWVADQWQFVEPGFSVDLDTVDLVADLIKRRSDAVMRRDALFSLNWYRSPSFVPIYLERLSNDPSPYVRAESLRILTQYRSFPGVDAALETAAADDPADNVRAEAARILDDASP